MKNDNTSLKEKNYKDFLNNQIIRFVVMIIIGLLGGYLVYRQSVKKEEPNIWYMFTVLIIFTVIGGIIFLCKVIPARKKYLNETKDESN